MLPDGIAHLTDLPYPLFHAIQGALMFLTFEELPEKERPPRDIWLEGDKLKSWFDDVKLRRESEIRDAGSGRGIDDHIEDAVQNDETAGLRDRLRSG